VGEPLGAPSRGGDTSAPGASSVVRIRSIRVESDHGALFGCDEAKGWRWSGVICPEPEWSASAAIPVSHSFGETVRLRVALDVGAAPSAPMLLRGEGPSNLYFEGVLPEAPGDASLALTSSRPLERALAAISFEIRWSIEGGVEAVSPPLTSIPMFVTFGPPVKAPVMRYLEDGATPRRMEKAVEWAKSAGSLDPHGIVASFLHRFPHYALLPDPSVPEALDHPRYFNDLGGAWPMVDHVKASGECQAIVRLVRGMLAQLGAPGRARMLVFWADPDKGGGEKPLSADWEEQPGAGLSKMKIVGDKRLVAALVDSPVVEGKTYPPSHTRMPDGSSSPGLNRYEACLEFSHGGSTRYYCGGVGVLSSTRDILKVFWGLVWVEILPDEGFRVETIVRRYRGGDPPRRRGRLRSYLRRIAGREP